MKMVKMVHGQYFGLFLYQIAKKQFLFYKQKVCQVEFALKFYVNLICEDF